MPKRKAASSKRQRPKRSKKSGPAKCPQLPQEILDIIIRHSLNVDTVLGVLPNQVHQNFQNPFMHVNRACREKTIELISSLTWIELRSLDHEHAALVHNLASQISFIDSFWSSILLRNKTLGRVIFEFDRTTARTTRRHVNDLQIFLSPYSYSSMLRLVSELGDSLANIERLNTCSEWTTVGEIEEVESVMKFLNIQTIMETKAGPHGRDFNFYKHTRNNMDSLLEFIDRISCAQLELSDEGTYASRLRAKLMFLYMSRCLTTKAGSVLRPPCFWTSAVLGSPGWRSNRYASKWVGITGMVHELETNAFHAFGELLVTDYRWIAYHVPYLTNDYHRFVNEPRFMFFGISDDEIAEHYRNVGLVIGVYNVMNDMTLKPIRNPSKLCELLQKKTHALTCASKLKPENTRWEDDARDAQMELLHYFPQEGREEPMREYNFYHYADADGEERTWLENDMRLWGKKSLTYLHRAREVDIYATAPEGVERPN